MGDSCDTVVELKKIDADFVFANFYKIIKKYVRNKMSDEILINKLFDTVSEPINLTNKNGEEYYINKETTSNILTRKEEIPLKIKNAIIRKDLVDAITDGIIDFVNEDIEEKNVTNICNELKVLYTNDLNYYKENKEELDSAFEYSPKFIAKVFISTLIIANKLTREKKTIWKKGKNSINVINDNILRLAFNKKYSGEEKIVVIPVENSFDMHIDTPEVFKPRVAISTIHGKWIKEIEKRELF